MNAEKKGQKDDTTKERLRLILERVGKCCQPPQKTKQTLWPDRVFLQSLENAVMLLAARERKRPPLPAWKAFQLLNPRLPSLQMVKRVNNLVKRARERLEEAGQAPLSKLASQEEHGDKGARKLLDDIGRLREDVGSAKAVDWKQHAQALAQFSRSRSVEPSYGRSAPPEFRCYARALELIVDDYRRKPLRDKSQPLIEWTARIGHPEAKNLCAFDDVVAWIIEQEEGAWRGKSALRKREKGRERVRKHREWRREAWVYPGDWLRHSHKKPLPAWAKVNPDACCELCGKLVSAGDYWYIQRTDNHRSRCSDCQSVIWELDGYEVSYPSGFPGGAWSKPFDEKKADLKHDAARYAESISEVLGAKYIPERIKELIPKRIQELLAAEQANAG